MVGSETLSVYQGKCLDTITLTMSRSYIRGRVEVQVNALITSCDKC